MTKANEVAKTSKPMAFIENDTSFVPAVVKEWQYRPANHMTVYVGIKKTYAGVTHQALVPFEIAR